jgi:hypothetical protein
MKYWYDTEFYEDGQRIHLISIGIVAEDGREYYAESDFVWNMVPTDHWLWENVFPHLDFNGQTARPAIARGVHSFITNGYTDHDNQLWGYYSAYDHVVLAQLFGRMVDMPQGVPWFTRDIKQEQERLSDLYFKHGLLLPEQKSTAHNALNDAKWTKEAYEFLVRTANENHGKEIVDGWS